MAEFKRQSVQNINPELRDPTYFNKDPRKFSQKFSSAMVSMAPLITAVMGGLIFIFPMYGDVFFIAGVFVNVVAPRSKSEYLLDAPAWSKYLCRESLNDAMKEGRFIPRRRFGKGTLIFGIEYIRGKLLVTNRDIETRHSLVLGSTGSGKTVLILSLLIQALLQPGTSAVVVDGKADIELFWKIAAILKRLNRLHDLLVMNCLSPVDCMDSTSVHDDQTISHTMNPLNFGTPDQMRTITMGLGHSSDGGDAAFWQGRSSTMVGALFQYMVYERDVEKKDLNFEIVRQTMALKEMIKKAARADVPMSYKNSIQQYLKTLPSISDEFFTMSEEEIDSAEIYHKADEQHIYNLMMISQTMSELNETLAHIFVTKLSHINMTDVCYGGRVLLVLLPSIAKSPDAVAGLGRLQLESLRPVLMKAAGFVVQGRRANVIDNRVSSSKYPVRLFLDEYGMYSVKGFFVLVSLIRTYGFHILFGAQTAGMFKRAGGQEEYEALMGNLNTKVILKNEDHEESLRLVLGRTGKVFHARQDRMETGLTGAEHVHDGRIEEGDMVNARMLASAKPGEGLYISGGDVHPFRALNLEIPEIDSARLNSFAQVLAPSKQDILAVKKIHNPKSEEDLIEYSSEGRNVLSFDMMRKGIDLASEKNIDSVAKKVMMAFGLMQIGYMNKEPIEVIENEHDSTPDSFDEYDSIQGELNAFQNEPDFQIDELNFDDELESNAFDENSFELDDNDRNEIDFSDFDNSDEAGEVGIDIPDIAGTIDFDYEADEPLEGEQGGLIQRNDQTPINDSAFSDTPAKMFEDEIRKKFASTFVGDSAHEFAQIDDNIDIANILDSTIESMTESKEPLKSSGLEGERVIVQALTYPGDVESYNHNDAMLNDAINKIKSKISKE